MRQPFRILRQVIIVLSSLLCIASLVFWIRSPRNGDTLKLTRAPTSWRLITANGHLCLAHTVWLNTDERQRGLRLNNSERSFLGFGITQAENPQSYAVPAPGMITYATNVKTYFIPLWFSAALFSILPLLHLRLMAIQFFRRKSGLCPHCGYDLRASQNLCPECGRSVQPTKNKIQNPPLPTPR